MDLAMIQDWYRMNFDDKTALKVVNSIIDSLERVAVFPESGLLTPCADLNKRGGRIVFTKRHAAVYRRIGESVYVLHIFDTRRDYVKLLRRMKLDDETE